MALLQPARAVQLHRLVDHPLGVLGGEQLGHRGGLRDLGGRRPRVVRRRGRAHQQPGRLGAGRHLGEGVLDRLLPEQQVAVDLAGQRPVQRGVERRLGHADRERADARPEQVERAHRHREAVVDLSEHVVGGDPDAVEDERADRVRGQQVEPLAAQTLGVAGHHERRDAAGAGAFGGAGEDRVDVGVGRVGDPGLLAVQPPPVTVRGRPQGEGRGVRAGIGLGQRESRDDAAGDHPGIQRSTVAGDPDCRIG